MVTRGPAFIALYACLVAGICCAVSAGARQTGVNVAIIPVDFDGDGRADRFELRLENEKVVALAAMATGKHQRVAEFEKGDLACSPVTWVKDCVNKRPVIEVVEMDALFRKEFGDMFELDANLLATSDTAHVLVVPIGETDPLWFFWNRQAGEIQWARL